MGLFRRKDNWYIDYYVNGRRQREKIGTNKRQAEMVLQKRKVQVAEDRFLNIRIDSRIQIDDIAKDFLVYSKNNKRSYVRDTELVHNLLSFFANKRLNEITPAYIEKYKGIRLNEDNKKPATVNREVACLKAIFNYAIKNKKATDNPVRAVKMLKENNTRTRYLSEEEINRLLPACPKGLKPIVQTALLTGMRLGEILNQKWEDIDFDRGIILIKNTKSGYSREIPIGDALKKVLLYAFDNSDGVHAFCNENRKPYSSIHSLFDNTVKRAGIADFRFHDLRHTAASYMVMRGLDLVTIKEILGHSTIKMTMRYAHLSPVHKRESMEIFSSAMDTIWTPSVKASHSQETGNMLFIDGKSSDWRRGRVVDGGGLENR